MDSFRQRASVYLLISSARLAPPNGTRPGCGRLLGSKLAQIVIDELDEEHELTGTVLSDLEKFSDRIEPGALREMCRDLVARDAAK